MSHLHIRGMGGLGDCLHQRAVLRELLAAGHRIWLETCFPCVYHDLLGPQLSLMPKQTPLRTQTKNAQREARSFTAARPPASLQPIQVSYSPDAVRREGSVLAAMSKTVGVPVGDFRLPIPPAWRDKADALLAKWSDPRPVLIYRPLMERTEWGGCPARNPDHDAYAEIFASIRDRFFVVSIADLAPRVEWMVGRPIRAEVEFHHGELDFETIAALTARAGLVYASPGFAVILAQAVGTPVACVFGGYENGSSFSSGARFSPYLPIEPITPCSCFSHTHRCAKAIDVPAAIVRLQSFIEQPLSRAA